MSQNTILELIGTTGTPQPITFFHVIVYLSMCVCNWSENNFNENIFYERSIKYYCLC